MVKYKITVINVGKLWDNVVSGNLALTLAICHFLVFIIFIGNLMEAYIWTPKIDAIVTL